MTEQLALDFEGPRMTVEEQAVLSLLGHGRARAVKERWLTDVTGINGRRVRQVIRHLIMQHNVLIASVTTQPAGFYLPCSRQEIYEATRSLRRRHIKGLMRVAKMAHLSLEEIFHQGRIEFEGQQ